MVAAALLCFLVLQNPSNPQARAVEILQHALSAQQNASAVAYMVIGDYTDDSGKTYKGHTEILVQKSPFHFRAAHQADDKSNVQFAVSDGKTTRASDGGTADSYDTFVPDGRMIVDDDAATDVASVWRLLLDPAQLQKMISSGEVLYLWQDDIEGDLCDVLIYAHDNMTDYLWFSEKTGLPRALQRVNMVTGRTRLVDRKVISNIRLNPTIPADAFVFAPPAVPKTAAARIELKSAASAPQEPHLVGQPLPKLELRDPQYRALSMSQLAGTPTLIAFWAPWCGPCQAELSTLEKLQPRFRGKFQIVAVAVQDQRLKAIQFIAAHPQYKFQFFTDPDMESAFSPLESFFGIVGIPVSVFADAHGKIVAEWNGFDNEADLLKKLTRLAAPPAN